MKHPVEQIHDLEGECFVLARIGGELCEYIRDPESLNKDLAREQLVQVDARLERVREQIGLLRKVYFGYIRSKERDAKYAPIDVPEPVRFFAIETVEAQAA